MAYKNIWFAQGLSDYLKHSDHGHINTQVKAWHTLFLSLFALQISYQSIESFDPSVNVPGPRRTVSKLKNETYHMFSGLQPGTTYLVSLRARTAKGFGQTTLTEITTNISGRCWQNVQKCKGQMKALVFSILHCLLEGYHWTHLCIQVYLEMYLAVY